MTVTGADADSTCNSRALIHGCCRPASAACTQRRTSSLMISPPLPSECTSINFTPLDYTWPCPKAKPRHKHPSRCCRSLDSIANVCRHRRSSQHPTTSGLLRARSGKFCPFRSTPGCSFTQNIRSLPRNLFSLTIALPKRMLRPNDPSDVPSDTCKACVYIPPGHPHKAALHSVSAHHSHTSLPNFARAHSDAPPRSSERRPIELERLRTLRGSFSDKAPCGPNIARLSARLFLLSSCSTWRRVRATTPYARHRKRFVGFSTGF